MLSKAENDEKFFYLVPEVVHLGITLYGHSLRSFLLMSCFVPRRYVCCNHNLVVWLLSFHCFVSYVYVGEGGGVRDLLYLGHSRFPDLKKLPIYFWADSFPVV